MVPHVCVACVLEVSGSHLPILKKLACILRLITACWLSPNCLCCVLLWLLLLLLWWCLLVCSITACCCVQFYEFYQLTIDKWWGRPYLKREFFHRIGADMGDEVLLVVAEEQGETVAAALNMIGRSAGRGGMAGMVALRLHVVCLDLQGMSCCTGRMLTPRISVCDV